MFPKNPIRGEIYIVANKEWLYNGYGFIPVPDSSLTEELDPIWNSEKQEYTQKIELEDYVPLDVLDSTLTDYVPSDILDSTLIDYVKQEEISDIMPSFQKTITQDQFVWYNDYLVIDIGEISHSKKVTILNLYIYTSKGIIKGTSIVSYPTAKTNTTSLPFTYFYLKDTLGIISKANDIEKISISYNISNQDREVDIQGTLGRNILFEETAGNQAHGKFVMDSFHGVYPENTHQKILSIDLPEVSGNVLQEFQPYICSKYECNLVTKPYVGAAVNENYLSNPEILTIGSHYNNDNIRRDITSGPDKFLSNTVAVSAGQNKDDTTSLWTSYGYGVEFFESWAKEEIDQRYPDKLFDHAIARIITTPDNQGLIYKSSGIGWSAIVEVGQKVRVRYSASNEVEVTVTSIVSDDEIRINQTVAPILETDSHKYLWDYVTVGAIGYYRPQQSPTCGMVAAKFREIQDKTNANWQVCREAARATASNSTFTLEGTNKVWTTNWDMYRGFGIIDVDSAVEYIHQHYIDNVDYKKSAAYTLPKSNPFLGIDDIERDTFVSKANLEEYVERIEGSGSVTKYDVISDVTVGSIEPGDTINQGSTLEDFIKQLIMKTFYPTFTNPSVSASTVSKEVGSSSNVIAIGYTKSLIKGDVVSGVWDPSATQGNRTGDLNKVWVNGVDNGTSLSVTIVKLTSLGSNSIPVKIDYSSGIQPKDSTGANYLSPLPAGSLTTNAIWSGFYYRTAIAGNSVPSAIDVRNSYTVRRSSGGVLNLASGTSAKRFDVFVPQGSSLTSAIDEGNLNLDITAEFVLQPNFSGLDANGDEVLYKHYLRQIGNPYTSNSNLKITIT